MAKGHWTRRKLADDAIVSDGVIGKILSGKPVHNATLMKVLDTLQVDIESIVGDSGVITHAPDRSPDHLGAYEFSEVEHLVGSYFGYRRRYDRGHGIYRSFFSITWDDKDAHLTFIETQIVRRRGANKVTATHSGPVSISRQHRTVHLITQTHGSVRLITLVQPAMGDTDFRGVVLTQHEVMPQPGLSYFVPGISPLYLRKLSTPLTHVDAVSRCGTINAADTEYESVDEELCLIERGYVSLAFHGRDGN